MSLRLAAALIVLAGCSAPRGVSDVPAPTEISGSLQPLRAWFEAHAGTPRVLMLLSPV